VEEVAHGRRRGANDETSRVPVRLPAGGSDGRPRRLHGRPELRSADGHDAREVRRAAWTGRRADPGSDGRERSTLVAAIRRSAAHLAGGDRDPGEQQRGGGGRTASPGACRAADGAIAALSAARGRRVRAEVPGKRVGRRHPQRPAGPGRRALPGRIRRLLDPRRVRRHPPRCRVRARHRAGCRLRAC
jgi:hypothetical protein